MDCNSVTLKWDVDCYCATLKVLACWRSMLGVLTLLTVRLFIHVMSIFSQCNDRKNYTYKLFLLEDQLSLISFKWLWLKKLNSSMLNVTLNLPATINLVALSDHYSFQDHSLHTKSNITYLFMKYHMFHYSNFKKFKRCN